MNTLNKDRVSNAALVSPAVESERTEDELPSIIVDGRHIREVTDDALEALQKRNQPPRLFMMEGSPVRLRTDENDRIVIDHITRDILSNELARAGNMLKNARGQLAPCSPPGNLVADILSCDSLPFPRLVGIIEAPALRPDGTIICESGYDAQTGLYYKPAQGLEVPEIPDRPRQQAVAEAVGLIDELLQDFPFVDRSSWTNALALLFTPVLRPVIKGPVPLALVNARQAGTGKSLLAKIVSLIATGRDCEMGVVPRTNDEWRKAITARLKAGAAIIVFDNVDAQLKASALASALTSEVWTDRILGGSHQAKLPQRAVWVATGNNISLGGDLPRRCYQIALDANMPDPHLRREFRHPDLPMWVRENRGNILAALLTICRYWFKEGKPTVPFILKAYSENEGRYVEPETPRLGSFESWCDTVGSMLVYYFEGGFLGNALDMHENTNEEAQQWKVFLECWYQVFADKPVTVKDIGGAIGNGLIPNTALPDDIAGKRSLVRSLGRQLRSRSGSWIGSYQIKDVGQDKHLKIRLWQLSYVPAGTRSTTRLEPTFSELWFDLLSASKDELPDSVIERQAMEYEEEYANAANPAGCSDYGCGQDFADYIDGEDCSDTPLQSDDCE